MGVGNRLTVFENRMLWGLFDLRRINGRNEKLHHKELHNCTVNQIIKSRRIRWARHIACMEKVKTILAMDGKITLKHTKEIC